ncbi:hypothetical protein BGZ76_011092 [Entomortierella beljakovae]|nr:hypothetical protein BGZ76_011092 [Entomortierella beljakovae]
MLKIILLATVVSAASSMVFDCNCVPTIACAIVAIAGSNGMLGLSSIIEYNIIGTPQNHSYNVLIVTHLRVLKDTAKEVGLARLEISSSKFILARAFFWLELQK